jgi:hypothetical protein
MKKCKCNRGCTVLYKYNDPHGLDEIWEFGYEDKKQIFPVVTAKAKCRKCGQIFLRDIIDF